MALYQIKVNSSGSWANLASTSAERLPAVKEACEKLASAIEHGIAFRIIDCKTQQITEAYNNRPRPGEPHGWYAPASKHNDINI